MLLELLDEDVRATEAAVVERSSVTLAIAALIPLVLLSWLLGFKLRDTLLRYIDRMQRREYLRIGKPYGIEEREDESNEELRKRILEEITGVLRSRSAEDGRIRKVKHERLVSVGTTFEEDRSR